MTIRPLLLAASLALVPLADAAAAGIIGLTTDDVFMSGEAAELRVVPIGLPADAVVTLLASTAPATGPCSPSGVCAGIAAPYRQLDRNDAPHRPYRVSVSVPPSTAPGQVLYLQAVARSQGVVVAASDVFVATVQPHVFGCTDPAFGTYDAAATRDDGSCACPMDLTVTSAADLAPHLGCTTLGDINARAWSEPLFSLPALERAGFIDFRANTTVTRVELPALRTVDRIQRASTQADVDVVLDALTWAGRLDLVRPTALRLPALTAVGSLNVRAPATGVVEAPLLEEATWLSLADVTSAAWPFPSLHALFGLSLTGDVGFDVDLALDPSEGALEVVGVAGPSQVRVQGWTSAVVVAVGSGPSSTVTDVLLPDVTEVSHLDVAVDGPFVHVGLGGASVDVVGILSVAVGGAQVSLSGVTSVGWLWLEDSQVTALAMPDLTTLGLVTLANNLVLADLDLPLLTCDGWSGTFRDNPQLCVTAELPLGQAPGTCSAVGSGNQCDP